MGEVNVQKNVPFDYLRLSDTNWYKKAKKAHKMRVENMAKCLTMLIVIASCTIIKLVRKQFGVLREILHKLSIGVFAW